MGPEEAVQSVFFTDGPYAAIAILILFGALGALAKILWDTREKLDRVVDFTQTQLLGLLKESGSRDSDSSRREHDYAALSRRMSESLDHNTVILERLERKLTPRKELDGE